MIRHNRWSFLHRSDSRRARAARRRCLPQLDLLEKRNVPTIFFGASAETVTNGGGPLLDNVHVRLVFWGPQWSTPANQTLAHNFEASVDAILGSTYLSGLKQYSSALGGGSRVGTTFVTSSTPPPTIDFRDVRTMLRSNIEGTIPGDPGDDPHNLYYVVPQPGTKAVEDKTDTPPQPIGGLHTHATFADPHDGDQDTFYYGLTQNDGVLDTLTRTFSHELVESITDPDTDTGIRVNSPQAENELSDRTAQNFFARLDGNGPVVQSYLSVHDGAFIIPAAQSQSLHVDDIGILTVNGDQLPNPNDTITIGQGGTGGVRVTLNGEVTEFGPGIIFRIVVNAGNGNDTVNIDQTKVGVEVHLGEGDDVADISPSSGNLDTIRDSLVRVFGDGGSDALHLFDQANTAQVSYSIDAGNAGRRHSAIVLDHVENIVVDGGSAANTFEVFSTEAGTHTTVNGGSGDNTFEVRKTGAGSDLRFNGGAGADTFMVGSVGILQTLDDIAGTVTVSGGIGSGVNGDHLDLLDADNTAPATYTVNGANLLRGTARVIQLGIEAVSITGGTAANTYDVESVFAITDLSLFGGPGDDTFRLAPKGQNLGGIRHPVNFIGGDGHNTLEADNRLNALGATFGVNAPFLNFNGKGIAEFSAGIDQVQVFVGNGANTFDVERTAAGVLVDLFGGNADDTYRLAPTFHNLGDIGGPVTLIAGEGINTLSADDGLNPLGATFKVDAPILIRNGKELADFGTGIDRVSVFAGNGANTFNVERTAAGVLVDLFGGNADDTYQLAPTFHNLNDIGGPVTLIAGEGLNTLVANDSANAAGATFKVNAPILIRNGKELADFGTGIDQVRVLAGDGLNTFDVVRTDAAIPVSLFGGTGADTFNVRATKGRLEIQGGAGSDTVNVGNLGNTIDDIQGAISVNGGIDSAIDSLTVNDQGSITPHVYNVTANSISRDGAATITFANIDRFKLNKGVVKGNAPRAKGLAFSKSIKLGQLATLSGRLVDQDAKDKLTLTVDWGDGSAPQQSQPNHKPFALKHRFTAAGAHTVRAIWTDSTGQSNSQDLQLSVAPKLAKPGLGHAAQAHHRPRR